MSQFDAALLSRFGERGPRYTSYPTADRFLPSFGPLDYAAAIRQRNIGGLRRPLSLYLHLPFCRSLCFYCACNKIVTRDPSKGARYLRDLEREIELQAALLSADRRVTRMHWGGGTPTFHSFEELSALWRKLSDHFELDCSGDYSIEVDPRTADPELITRLRELGFNRVSFGVQDFDPAVQAAINRVQSAEDTVDLVQAARQAGYRSINVDLIYGLPKQTLLSFARTLARVVMAAPDRVALYNYAHLPTLFKSQRQMRDEDLPTAAERLELFELAHRRFETAGYLHIGMDHFARPEDPLAVAQRQGLLHRNFQGYSAGPESDLIGLGVSAIGAIGATYSQNHRVLSTHRQCLERGELPIMRGIELDTDDLARRAVIQALICHFAVCKGAIGAAHLIDFDRYFAAELESLREFEGLGLIEQEADWLTVTTRGRVLVRQICMVFDRHLRNNSASGNYSHVA